MIKVINFKKWSGTLAIALILISLFLTLSSVHTSSSAPRIVVAIDAGHGGIDGGTVGAQTGKDENFLNLSYAKSLEKILSSYGVGTVMTRQDLNGLYNPFAENKKLDDMARRKQIVQKSGANVLVSVHMNSFPLSSSRGAQVFFKAGDEKSEILAECIQSVFISALPEARKSTSVGDYYMLNEFDIPAVIVECGYLSNPEEELLLVDEEYQNLVCGSIFVGLIKFFAL